LIGLVKQGHYLGEQFTGLIFEINWAVEVEASFANRTAVNTDLGIVTYGLPAVTASMGLGGMIVRIE